MKTRLVYLFDPLCGWCFGFSPVIRKLEAAFEDRIEFDVISGGMILGDRVGPVRNFAHIIRSSKVRLEETTGVTFGDAFLTGILEEGTTIFSSLKPSIALCVAKDMVPERGIEFAFALQSAIYVDGIKPDETESYRNLATSFGLDADEFINRMSFPHYEMLANQGFAQSSKWGIQGFPSVVLFHKDQGYLIARGYMPYDTLAESVRSILE
jgi:putative protein-disulfide isomerase